MKTLQVAVYILHGTTCSPQIMQIKLRQKDFRVCLGLTVQMFRTALKVLEKQQSLDAAGIGGNPTLLLQQHWGLRFTAVFGMCHNMMYALKMLSNVNSCNKTASSWLWHLSLVTCQHAEGKNDQQIECNKALSYSSTTQTSSPPADCYTCLHGKLGRLGSCNLKPNHHSYLDVQSNTHSMQSSTNSMQSMQVVDKVKLT